MSEPVKRQPKPRPIAQVFAPSTEIARVPVESSNIASIGWDDRTIAQIIGVDLVGVLEIEFTSGGTYRYTPVPRIVYDDFLAAESKGKYFRAAIDPVYAYVRMSDPEVTP